MKHVDCGDALYDVGHSDILRKTSRVIIKEEEKIEKGMIVCKKGNLLAIVRKH